MQTWAFSTYFCIQISFFCLKGLCNSSALTSISQCVISQLLHVAQEQNVSQLQPLVKSSVAKCIYLLLFKENTVVIPATRNTCFPHIKPCTPPLFHIFESQ